MPAFTDENSAAITTAGEPTSEPWKLTLRRLIFDEDGQAMVELVVLLPVYLALIIGVIYMGHLQLVRQQTVEAARWYAWSTESEEWNISERAFFSRFSKGGSGSAGFSEQLEDFEFPDVLGDFKSEGDDDAITRLAQKFLNNNPKFGGSGASSGPQHRIIKQEAFAQYTYRFSYTGRFGPTAVTQTARHTVYMGHAPYTDLGTTRRQYFRPGFRHPIEEFTKDTADGRGAFETTDDVHYLPHTKMYDKCLGSAHASQSCLWNTRHNIDNQNNANPHFFRDLYKFN